MVTVLIMKAQKENFLLEEYMNRKSYEVTHQV